MYVYYICMDMYITSKFMAWINDSCDHMSSFSGARMLEWCAVGLGVRTRFALTAAYALVLNPASLEIQWLWHHYSFQLKWPCGATPILHPNWRNWYVSIPDDPTFLVGQWIHPNSLTWPPFWPSFAWTIHDRIDLSNEEIIFPNGNDVGTAVVPLKDLSKGHYLNTSPRVSSITNKELMETRISVRYPYSRISRGESLAGIHKISIQGPP